MAPASRLLAFAALPLASALLVTIRNDIPRVDTSGAIIDCHSGMILLHDGVFYMYGEHYGNSSGYGPSPPIMYPKVVVYTSPDMMAWTYRGFAVSQWPTAPWGTFFTPWVVFNAATNMFVMWFNAYLNGCCEGGFGVATSPDGVNFTLVSLNATGAYGQVDCNGLLVDDDGVAYLVYSSLAEDHRVSIERLNDEYTGFAGVNYGLLPDHYVEGSILFKRNGVYYVSYGSCCCFCRAGAGAVVYSATSIAGPWVEQPYDVNCNSSLSICGGYGERVVGDIIISAQGIGLSVLPATGGGNIYLWHGERWVSAPNNNPQCPDECQPETGPCAEPASYIKGHGFSYWTPLSFDASGAVQQFAPFVNSYTIDVNVSGGVNQAANVQPHDL